MYEVRLTRRTERGLARIHAGDRRAYERIRQALESLGREPRPSRAVRLKGLNPPAWRLRVGDYRVVYEIYDRQRAYKARRVIAAWVGRRCLDARARGDIKVSEEAIKRLTTYDTEESKEGQPKKPARPPFSVCSRMGTYY